jgi:hypothetical protein
MQKRCDSIAIMALNPIHALDSAPRDALEIHQKPDAYPSRLDGISIAYHFRRRQVLESSSRTAQNARVIAAQDPITGFLHLDEPGVVGEHLEYARALYANTSVAERRRMVMEELGNVVEHTTISVSSKEYGGDEMAIKRKLKRQLLDCATTKDIFRVVAAALQNPQSARRLVKLGEGIVRAFFRSRSSTTDFSIAIKIMVLIRRFEKLGLTVQPILVTHGLKFAIRSRDLEITKRYLRELRHRKIDLSTATFRAIIAKCSIGKQGFGEIRNGRWKRHELLQVLLGFRDAPEENYHLATFLNRNDWQYTAAWSQILSRCGAYDDLWQEWILWKNSDARKASRPVQKLGADPQIPWNWRLRGDRWFIQVFIDAGLLDWAWKALEDTSLDPFILRRECLHQLLERIDLATFWNERLQQALEDKLVEDLGAIEQMLGVQWVHKNGISFHAPAENCREALEMLAEADFFTRYGYITNEPND